MKLDDHPAVRRFRLQTVPPAAPKSDRLDPAWLKQLVLDAGAADVGFVEIGRPALDDQRDDIFKAFPHTRTLISFVVRMNREAIRTPARSVSNTEFHHSGDEVNDIARSVVQTLEDRGIRAMNPAMGFPMEMDRFPGKVWVVSHKPVAVAAGLGMMGIHRNVIHEKFGNFILLGTILLDAEVSESSRPEKTLLGRSSPIERHISRKSCGPFKRRRRRFTSPRIPTLRIMSPNGFPTKESSTWATACGRTP